MLSKYDQLPDHFHDLQTTLLKKAASKNIENLQEAINLQQTYTTSLCGHINSIYTKLAQLDRQVQMHCLYLHPQSDVVQINAPEYHSDIDGQTGILPGVQPFMASLTASTAGESSHAKNIQEDTAPANANSQEDTVSLQASDRLESQSQPFPDNTDHSVHQDTEQPRAEYPSNYRPQLEDIPELEDNEEN